MPTLREWPLEAERELLADACVHGRHPHALWNFVRFACGWYFRCRYGPMPKLWLQERVHRPMLDWVDAQIADWYDQRRRGIMRRVQVAIIWPRGHGKSNTITKTIPLYCMLIEPDSAWHIGSETHPKARDFLAAIKPILDGSDPHSLFTWLYGNWYSPDKAWNQTEIVTAARTSTGVSEPSIGTFGVETGITSKHPLGVIYDDPLTEEKLKDGGTWIQAALDSLDAIYPALRNDSIFFLVGTRYRDDDPIGTSLSTEGIKEWAGHDAIENYDSAPSKIWRVYFLQCRDRSNTRNFPKGEPVLPEGGYTDENLSDYERRSPQKFAAQMMNDPAVGEHSELTKEQIAKLYIDRKDLPGIEYATIHLDTAFKDTDRRERGDYSAIAVWLHDIRPTGIVYFDGGLRAKDWRSEDLDTALIRVMFGLRHRGIRIRAITDEIEVGGKRGVFKQHLEQVIGAAGLPIPEILQFSRAGTKKVVRIREGASYWLDGCVRLISDAENASILSDEMCRIGFTRHDDLSDAATDVFRPEIWRGRHQMSLDIQPLLPHQPGDEILKGQQYEQQWRDDMAALQRDIRSAPGTTDAFFPDPYDVYNA